MADLLIDYQKELFFIVSGMGWCMCLLQMVGIYKFNRLRGLMIIEKRYPQLVMLEAIVTCCILAIIYPAFMTELYKYPQMSGRWKPVLCIALNTFTSQIVPVIETCRIWLISYDLHYLHSSKTQQWKLEIDVLYAEKDWYLQNRGKWGSKQYIIRLGFIYWIVSSTIFCAGVILMVLSEDAVYTAIVSGVQFIIAIILMIIPIYLYRKTPRNLEDEFLFQYEFFATAVIASVAALVTIIGLGLFGSGNLTLAFTMNNLNFMWQLTPSLLSTIVVPGKVNAMTEWNTLDSPSSLSREGSISAGKFRHKLQETLKDEHQCEAFIDWMYREFSSEAILSFLEFVQFRKYVKEEEIGKLCVAGDTDPYDFALYDGMPKSTIVHDTSRLDQSFSSLSKGGVTAMVGDLVTSTSPSDDTLVRCKRIAHLMFKKYIDYHAEHEINISASLRKKFVELEQQQYDGMELEQFVTLYDEVISEMMKYQAESYRRFERAN